MDEPAETAELLAFIKIVEAKSISRAAAELGVPRATIGRRLARLESRLEQRLLRRSTRSLKLTDAGEVFYEQARLVLEALERAHASVCNDGAIAGALRVSVPNLSDESFLSMLSEFADRHPLVRMHVQFTTRHVDLRREGYDVALRATTHLEPGLMAKTISRGALLGVASPAYLEAHGAPRSSKELGRHRCLLGFVRGELPDGRWPTKRGTVRVEGAFASNDMFMLRNAALRGLGIAMLPGTMIHEDLEQGRLVRVLPGLLEVHNRLALVYPERELLPPQVRAFIDTVVAWAANAPLFRDTNRRPSSRRPR